MRALARCWRALWMNSLRPFGFEVIDIRLSAQIGRLDLLLLPVGGYYTIDAAQAMEVRRLLQPTVTVPMHYRTQYDPEMKIAPLADFLALSGAEDTQMPLLRAVKAEMGERPPVVTLAVQPG